MLDVIAAIGRCLYTFIFGIGIEAWTYVTWGLACCPPTYLSYPISCFLTTINFELHFLHFWSNSCTTQVFSPFFECKGLEERTQTSIVDHMQSFVDASDVEHTCPLSLFYVQNSKSYNRMSQLLFMDWMLVLKITY